jgi:hypothetical protein
VHPEVDPALGRDGRLAQEQRRERRIADAVDDRADERLVHVRELLDERDRVVVPAELDQARDHVQPVRELVLLRAQRLCEPAHVAELTQEIFELRAVAQRHDRADRPAAHGDRHPVDDEHPVPDEHDLIGALDVPRQDLSDVTAGNDLGQRPADRRVVEVQQPFCLVVDEGHVS